MIAVALMLADGVEAAKTWLVPVVGGCVPLFLYLLTRRSARADIVRGQATQVEQLYIGSAEKLLSTLQEELRTRNARIGSLEGERETLRGALTEERQVFDALKQRHRELVAFLTPPGSRFRRNCTSECPPCRP